MEVYSVAIAVIQKLTDMLIDEKSIISQLNEIKNDLEGLRGSFTEASGAATYLEILYSVEDTIESFALRKSLQRKRSGFLIKHGIFLKNFTAYKKLKRNIGKIKKEIMDCGLNIKAQVPNASLVSSTPRSDDIHLNSSTDDHIVAHLPKQSIRNVQTDGPAIITSSSKSDASLGSSTPRSDDIHQKSSTGDDIVTDLPTQSTRNVQTDGPAIITSPSKSDDSLGSSTPRSDDIHQKSSTDDDIVTDLPTQSTRNVQTDGFAIRTSTRTKNRISSSKSDVTVTFQEHHRPVKKSHSISYDRNLWSRLSTSWSYKAEELGLVGSGPHIKELTKGLTEGNHQIIRLVGTNGSGKTTLARAIHATKSVKDHFHSFFAWVTIDEDSTPKDILLNLLKQVDSSEEQGCNDEVDKLITLLNEGLKKKKFLIVLDNLRESNTWERIKNAFLDNISGTRIIITTRHEKVAKSEDTSYSLNLGKLIEADVLHLFRKKANSECPEDLREEILKICGGLPLNVVLLGSLLSTKDPARWQTEINKTGWHEPGGIVGLSYDDISDEERLCLLYMVLFPQEYDIPVRRLLRLWLAEGFIKPTGSDGKQISSEDNANKCFENLSQRSLILITNQRSDGGHRKCRLLGAMHEYLFSKAKAVKLFHVHKVQDCGEVASMGARRFVEFVDSKTCPFSEPTKLTSWRSYLSFNFQKKDTPAKEVGVLLSNMLKSGFSLLRVLDLEGVYKPSLPDNLGNFFQLRYLGLRWTFLDHLPSSVGDLTFLETLDLKHTNVNSLPASVWKLNHLRHLNLNDIRLNLPVTSNDSFPGLLTLCGLSIVDGECRVKGGLDRLRHLRELDLTFQLRDCGELLVWVSDLISLEQLRLRSKDDVGCAATLSLEPLSKLTNLSHMNLLGKLPTLLAHDEFPQNLKVLTFSASELQIDPMQTLGQLRHLTVLRLLAKSYLGKQISCPAGGFKELRVLKLWKLTNLEDWELGDKCMEKLNELSIRCCPKLESVPKELLEQSSFKELILNNMPDKFKDKAEQDKKSHVSVIVKDYDFTPLPWEEPEGDFSVEDILRTHVNGRRTSGSE